MKKRDWLIYKVHLQCMAIQHLQCRQESYCIEAVSICPPRLICMLFITNIIYTNYSTLAFFQASTKVSMTFLQNSTFLVAVRFSVAV